MARKTVQKTPDSKPQPIDQHYKPVKDAQWGGFVNIHMSEDDKRDFRLWQDQAVTEIGSLIGDVVRSGITLSLTYDAQNWCYVCSLTGSGWLNSGFRQTLTSRGGTYQDSIELALYKHLVMAEEDWGQYKTNGFKSEL